MQLGKFSATSRGESINPLTLEWSATLHCPAVITTPSVILTFQNSESGNIPKKALRDIYLKSSIRTVKSLIECYAVIIDLSVSLISVNYIVWSIHEG